jgi:ADP-heptose:LPS heptosyltransferase
LASAFPVRVLWFCDPNEPERAGPLPEPAIRVSLPIRQFIAVLARCQLLLCNDSGPMHIAAALGVPVVAVFGPQEPAWFGPLGPDHRIVIRPEFWCRPCFDYCRFDQPYCLRTISREEVGEAALSAVREISRRREPPSTPKGQEMPGEQFSASLR